LRLPDSHLDGLGSFLAYDPRRIEFRPEGRKFARKGVCPVSLLIKRLSLTDRRRFGGRLRNALAVRPTGSGQWDNRLPFLRCRNCQ
jgi:hypothetical protein